MQNVSDKGSSKDNIRNMETEGEKSLLTWMIQKGVKFFFGHNHS